MRDRRRERHGSAEVEGHPRHLRQALGRSLSLTLFLRLALSLSLSLRLCLRPGRRCIRQHIVPGKTRNGCLLPAVHHCQMQTLEALDAISLHDL